MRDQLLHPLVSSSFGNLVSLVAHYGCSPFRVHRLVWIGLMTLLRQPTIWAESLIYGRRVARQAIEPPPVFIIGHWRSGTTHLQNLMSCDPQFGRVTLMQAGMPRDLLVLAPFMKGDMGGLLPKKRLMDNVPIAADVPWEEELALTSVGRMSFYHVSFFPRCMAQIFNEAVLFNGGDPKLIACWRKQYLHFLRKIQLLQPGKPLLLKNPANTARIHQLREMFPGARFVHLKRDPYRVYVSSLHLYLKAQEAWGLHPAERERVVEQVLSCYPKLMQAFFDQRDELGPGELVDVRFEDVEADPLVELERIYQTLGLDGFDAARPHFERYIESQRGYQKNPLSIDPEEQREVNRRWPSVFRELDYPVCEPSGGGCVSDYRVVPNPRIGAYYVAAASVLAAGAVSGGGWTGWLGWPAGSCLLVAAGYFGLGPAIYRKRNGVLPWTTRLVLGPTLFGQTLSLWYYQRKCRPWDEAAPGVWMGRRLTNEEGKSARAQGVTAVLDLTTEFSEPASMRSTAYLNLPVLDLTAPAPEHLRQAVTFIDTHCREGVVYVHCKIGYSRTAAVVGAWLLAGGTCSSVQEAVDRMRSARPSMVVRPEAWAALERFWREQGEG